MSDSLEVWRFGDIAKAYGLPDQGEACAGEFRLATPFGQARPTLYQGDSEILERLGPLLADSRGKLGKLTLSRMLATSSGRYSLASGGSLMVLSTWEAGPVCDTHNTFELFTIMAGVAHWHQLTCQPGREVLQSRQQRYESLLLESLRTTKHPDLSKRSLRYWEELMDTWRNCIREGLALLNQVSAADLFSCVLLGIESFQDFVYLSDMHQVHYNRVDRCHVGLPTDDLTALLRACEGDLRIAESMLLSYTKVRSLSSAEQQLILAELWFPIELTLDELLSPNLNILALRRMQGLLEQKMALISDLEELLYLPALDRELDALEQDMSEYFDQEKEAAAVATRTTRNMQRAGTAVSVNKSQPNDSSSLEAEPTERGLGLEHSEPSIAVEDLPTAQAEAVEEAKSMDEERTPLEQEQGTALSTAADSETVETAATKKALVWKPFPRPLNAPPELVVVEQPVEKEQVEQVEEVEEVELNQEKE